MALTSTLTLTEVETAIRDILTAGASYVRPGLTLTRANLTELRGLRKELIREGLRSEDSGAALLSDTSGGEGSTEGDEWGD